MKTRLQLAQGYIDGTLTELEKKVAEDNPVVMQEVKSRKNAEIIPETEDKPNVRRKKTNG